MPKKYDDASWHSGGDYPRDLPPKAAATHIGQFLGWAVERGLGGEWLRTLDPVLAFRSHRLPPGSMFLSACDGKLTDEDLSDEGNHFAEAYYTTNRYLEDYDSAFGRNYESLYHVPDDWSTYETIARVLDRRLREHKGGKSFA